MACIESEEPSQSSRISRYNAVIKSCLSLTCRASASFEDFLLFISYSYLSRRFILAVSFAIMSRELLMPRLDYLATQEPHRAWASIPANDADLSQGFRDISYQKLMHTANNAASWVEKILGTANDHATFAYEGPRDLRHLILAIAARKLGKRVFDDFQPYSTQIANFVKILLMSSYSSIESRVRLMDAVQCDILLFADANDTTVRSILGERPSLQGLHVPSQIEWLDSENRDRHPYIKDWQIGKDDEWIIFHTSGTTGRPPITYFATEFLSFLTPGRKSKAYYLDPRNDVELSGFLEAAWGRQINSYIIQRPAVFLFFSALLCQSAPIQVLAS